jgi:hypothetical protein
VLSAVGSGRRAGFLMLLVSAVALAAGGCTGATSILESGGSAGYGVQLLMDPITLNPPQLGTLTFKVTNNTTNKVVMDFEAVQGALLHNVIVSKQLDYFRHDVAQHSVKEQVSVAAYFPRFGTYYTYALYKPAGAEVQEFRSKIVSGQESEPAHLEEQYLREAGRVPSASSDPGTGLSVSKLTNGLTVSWIKGTSTIRAGQPSQLLFRLTERGEPATSLWPLYGQPGHLWVVDENVSQDDGAGKFAHIVGSAPAKVLLPSATPAQGAAPEQGSSSRPVPSDRQVPAEVGTLMPVPTLLPSMRDALATITAVPYPTLAAVQQTPQSGLTGPQDVRPAIGFGPDVVFTHTFPHEGYYKMWMEIKWRDIVIVTDFVVRVEP